MDNYKYAPLDVSSERLQLAIAYCRNARAVLDALEFMLWNATEAGDGIAESFFATILDKVGEFVLTHSPPARSDPSSTDSAGSRRTY